MFQQIIDNHFRTHHEKDGRGEVESECFHVTNVTKKKLLWTTNSYSVLIVEYDDTFYYSRDVRLTITVTTVKSYLPLPENLPILLVKSR